MNVPTTNVWLLDTQTGQPKEAELRSGISEQQLLDWDGEWRPELYKSIQALYRAGIDRSQWPQNQSAHWDWRKKVATLQPMISHSGFCIVCDGMTEGMMLLDTVRGRCQIDEQKGKNLVYIDYVENAPWNRPELGTPPRFKGIGSILVGAAIRLSHAEEFKGRLGLHSLPQADDFYARTCGMTDLGPDSDKQNLRYFEMTSAQADAFIAKGMNQ